MHPNNAKMGPDPLGRYYTSEWVGNTLIQNIRKKEPTLILELGAGEGSLTNAAALKWQNSSFITVDVDNTTKPIFRWRGGPKNYKHHVHDVLDLELPNKIGLPLSSADIALCNPPYIRPKWRNGFSKILRESGFENALDTVYDAGSDLLFIAQNLRLLKENGKLGLILPDGLITGEKFVGIRKVLLREHKVEQVIQLPRNAFNKTEAQTYLMTLSKFAGPTQNVKISSIDLTGKRFEPIDISMESGFKRLDYRYHSIPRKVYFSKSRRDIGSITVSMERGTINSKQIEKCEFPVFHLSNFPLDHKRFSIHIPKRLHTPLYLLKTLPATFKYAKPGDILIARVGRNLQDKVCMVMRGSCVVSDCIFVLRVKKSHRNSVLNLLKSRRGKELLFAASHGVGASYLCKADIFSISASYFNQSIKKC